MLRPAESKRQSSPRLTEFEAALRRNEPLLAAANVTIRSGEETQAVTVTDTPEVPALDPDRKLIWTVGVSAMRLDLSALLAKPAVAPTTALNSKNAVVQSVGSALCMLARSTNSPSQFLFSADQAGTHSVAITVSSIDLEPWARRSNAAKIPAEKLPPTRTADQVRELARDAAGNALAGGGGEADADVAFAVDDAGNKIKGTLKDGAVDPAKLEAGTVAQKIALRRAIGAEGELQAGAGVVIGAPDRNGVRRIGVQNPTAVAGGALGAESAYGQTRLDRLHDWRMEAIQYTEPHVINLTWSPTATPQIYKGSTEITPGVTGVLGYVPLSQSSAANRGKFTLATKPDDTTRTRANLISGETVISLILKIGADLAAAKAADPITIPVERDDSITDTFALVAKERLTADPAGLASANAVAVIDFGLPPTYSNMPDSTTVTTAKVTEALQADPTIAGITTDGTTLYLLERQRPKVGAITLSTLIVDSTKSIESVRTGGYAGGITTDGTNLYVAGRGRKVTVYRAGDYVTEFTMEDHATGITFDGTHLLVGVDTFVRRTGEVVVSGPTSVKGYLTNGDRVTAKDVPASVFTGIDPAFGGIGGLAWNADENLLYVTSRGGRIVAIRKNAYDPDSTPPATITGGTSVGGLAYRDGVLMAAGRVGGPVVSFRVTTGRSAYRTAYDFRTVDQPELRRLAREQHVKTLSKAGGALSWTEVGEDGKEKSGAWTPPVRTPAVARLPAPGTAGRQVWVEADYDNVRQGEYLDTGAAWVPADFNAPPGDPEHDFRLLMQETIPGRSHIKAVVFAAVSGTPGRYRAAAPFGAIDSIEFDARAASATLNRYVVRLRAGLAVGGGIPAVLLVGASRYALAAGTAADGEAVFVTSLIEASDRVAAGSLTKQLDLQDASGAWANGSGQQTVRRTLTREALQAEIRAWFTSQAYAANTETWPLAKLPISKLTQAQYDAGVAAGTIANGNNRVYLIVG